MHQRRVPTAAAGVIRLTLCQPVAFALLGAAVLFFFATPVCAQISPGPLSKPHSSLAGTTQCGSCHVFGAKTPTFKCLDCHKEIADDLTNKHGYHFHIQMQNTNGKDCVRCHLEHNGESFNLIHWEPSRQNFDHRLTGFPLQGKHVAVSCEKCHTAAHMVPELKSLIQYRDPAKSFFAQSPNCTPCHSDPHKGQLGNECTKCHNVENWKAAKEFDHAKTRYPLTGLHTKVACENCHKPDIAGGAPRYTGMKFDSCSGCHSDPHRGTFKKSCDSCHTTKSWKTLLAGFDFDHSKTKYPLLGKHVQVSCSACHVRNDFKKEIAFANCKDCHVRDPHKGQFDGRPRKGDCAECHTVNGFAPSLFSVKEHESTQYPLRGKHTTVECAKCHAPAGQSASYKLKFAACSDCHNDAHDKQFAAAPYNNRCESCHTVQDWHRTTFSIAQHRSTRFPLQDAHLAVPCSDCHKLGFGGRADKVLPFHFGDLGCTACHKDPHNGQFQTQMARQRADGSAFGCEACHNVKSWGEISGFDHSKTKFVLLGAHRTVACSDCHKPTANTESRFRGVSTQCEACHNDPHDGQFAVKDAQTRCAECHTSQRWAPSIFDHDAKAHFPLSGGHTNVPCAKCHSQTRSVGDKAVVIYKNAPGKCAACHGSTTDKL